MKHGNTCSPPHNTTKVKRTSMDPMLRSITPGPLQHPIPDLKATQSAIILQVCHQPALLLDKVLLNDYKTDSQQAVKESR